ncbi:MAG: PH domain-containing protein [Verrucomicrobiota bacterium]
MGLINALFGTASQINSTELETEFRPILIEGEQITAAFKIVRDLVIFTQCRLILADKQGMTGKKVEYHSIPYKSISQFSVETAGHFDMDSELKIWISSNPLPLKKEFKKGTDIIAIQKLLATYLLR